MKKRVILIHGWGGKPGDHWKTWFRLELEKRGIEVVEPQMPNPNEPKPEEWISYLKELVGTPNENACLVGHSLGCPTIIKYLSTLNKNEIISGAVLVAGLHNFGKLFPEIAEFNLSELEIKNAKNHVRHIVSIFSDNDPDAPIDHGYEFQRLLNSELVVENSKGHFCGEDGVFELPSVLNATLKILSL